MFVTLRAETLRVNGVLPCAVLAGLVGATLAAGPAAAQTPREPRAACIGVERSFETGKGELETPQLTTLLFSAADNDCTAIAPKLLTAGANVNARDRSGNTALIRAARNGRVAMITFLLESGADLEQRNLDGATPLLAAIEGNRTKAAETLLAAGANVATAGRSGVAPLAAAAYNGNLGMVEVLLAHKADPGAADSTGKTAIDYAAARGFTQIVARLLDAGVDVNAQDAHGLTALAWAAGHADDVPEAEAVALVTLLLARGANPALADDRGMTPLAIAKDMNHAEVAALIAAKTKP